MAKRYHKKIVSWYVHGSVTGKTRLMEKLSDVILTANEKSFRMKSDKVKFVGHGIDTEMFCHGMKKNDNTFNIFTAGRISPTKHYETLIEAMNVLRASGRHNIVITIAGEPVMPADRTYLMSLKSIVLEAKFDASVIFLGAVPHHMIPQHLQQSDIFVNLSGTGSVDKAVLEAMSCQIIPITSNEAFENILPPRLLVHKNDPKSLATAILSILDEDQYELSMLRKKLRDEVLQHHDLNNLVTRIIDEYGAASR